MCLHLLQISLIYINTLLLQRVLAEPEWLGRLALEERRGLTPLIYSNVDPYGVIRLDMAQRLAIDGEAVA